MVIKLINLIGGTQQVNCMNILIKFVIRVIVIRVIIRVIVIRVITIRVIIIWVILIIVWAMLKIISIIQLVQHKI